MQATRFLAQATYFLPQTLQIAFENIQSTLDERTDADFVGQVAAGNAGCL